MWSVYSLLQGFLFCLTSIDASLCILKRPEHAFPCTVSSACLTWRPRKVPVCLAPSIKLSLCVFSDTAQATFVARPREGYSTPHQSNIFCSFCFRCYHTWEDCSMTVSRPALSQCVQPALARHHFKANHSSPKRMTSWMIFSCCNTVYSFTHSWGLKAREHLRLIFHLQVSPSRRVAHPTLSLGTELWLSTIIFLLYFQS